MATVRLLAIFVLLALCACSIAPPARLSPPENALPSSLPPSPTASPTPTVSPSPTPTVTPTPAPFEYVPTPEPVYPELSPYNLRVLAQHECEGVLVTQFHYFFELDGEDYEGTTINAKKNVDWKDEWRIAFTGGGDGQYDRFRPFVSGAGQIYLLHGMTISARDIWTGEELWSLPLYGPVNSGAEDSNGNLYVSTWDSPLMTAISPAGEILR